MVKNNYSVLINNKYVEVSNIYAVGRNYIDHAKEMKSEVSNDPIFFQKALTSLSKSPTIILPKKREIHHELEVVVLVVLYYVVVRSVSSGTSNTNNIYTRQ